MKERLGGGLQDKLPLRSLSGVAALTLSALSLAACGGGGEQKSGEWRVQIGCPARTTAKLEEVVQPSKGFEPTIVFTCEDRAGYPHRPKFTYTDFAFAANNPSQARTESGPGWFAIDYEYGAEAADEPFANFQPPLYRSRISFAIMKLHHVQSVAVHPAEGILT